MAMTVQIHVFLPIPPRSIIPVMASTMTVMGRSIMGIVLSPPPAERGYADARAL